MSSALTLREKDAVQAALVRPWLTPWEAWGLILIIPYIVIFLLFVVSGGIRFWLARHPHTYVELVDDPIFRAVGDEYLVFLVVGINIKMVVALLLLGSLFRPGPDQMAVGAFHSALGAVDPHHPVAAFHAQSGMGRHQYSDFPADREDGPNWLNDPAIALSMAIAVHIWKSLPFDADPSRGRLAIP
jgi:multiple sugar transport system permease protein